MAAGHERKSTVVVHFLAIGYISAWQCQMDAAWISVWAPERPPGARGEDSHNLAHDKALCYGAYAEIPSSACSGQLLTVLSLKSLKCFTLMDYDDLSEMVARMSLNSH